MLNMKKWFYGISSNTLMSYYANVKISNVKKYSNLGKCVKIMLNE